MPLARNASGAWTAADSVPTTIGSSGDSPAPSLSARRPRRGWARARCWRSGSWRMGDRTLTLIQQYQMVSGSLGSTAIADGKVNGDTVTFTAGGRTYTGHVNGERMTGSGWSAIKAPGPVSARP